MRIQVFLPLIILMGLLWATLATAVGFHAKGHNRSGIVWFLIVLITGIFGLAFYLLAITSKSGKKVEERGINIDNAILSKGPTVLISILIGFIASASVGEIFWNNLFEFTNEPGIQARLGTWGDLLFIIVSMIGLFASPYVAIKHGWRRLLYFLSYSPVLFVSIFLMGGVLEVGEDLNGGNFHENPYIPLALLLFALVVGIYAWKRFHSGFVKQHVQSTIDWYQQQLN